jgi:hypothetical protein
MNIYEIYTCKLVKKGKYDLKYSLKYNEVFVNAVNDICFNKCLSIEKNKIFTFDECFENCEIKNYSCKLLIK